MRVPDAMKETRGAWQPAVPMATAGGGPKGRVYRSVLGRRAFWRTLPVAVAVAIALHTWSDLWGWPGNLAVLAVSGAFAAWLLLGTTYRTEHGVLKVRLLLRRADIQLSEITGVRRRSSVPLFELPWSADYALGTAVIEIDEGGWKTLVSPRDEVRFLAALGEGARTACTTSEPTAED